MIILMAVMSMSSAIAQELSVKSFSEKSNDISASTSRRLDNNGTPCALVKVQLASSGALFEGNVMGTVEYKTSEYWVYMPQGSKRLTVKLEGYLPLAVEFADYGISSLEPRTTYQLVITGVATKTQPQDEPRTQTGWIRLDSEPSDAAVYIEGNYAGQTPYGGKYPFGNYTYRVEKNKYHASTGTISLQTNKVEKTVRLAPAFGSVRVTDNVGGAKVLIDGNPTSETTPCTLREVPSGTHQIAVQKDKYAPYSQNVAVSDGEETLVKAVLEARFATITINTMSGAQILVNGRSEGRARIERELMEGYYDVEVRLEHHKPASRQIQVEAGKSQEITLNPTPIYGSLDVTSTPFDAAITIDGQSYGETPNTIDRLLEGEHTVVLTKSGYAAETQTVTIREGQTSTVTATLRNGCPVRVTASKSGARVYVDGEEVGTAPYSGTLTFGSHTLYAIADGKRSQEQEIVIRQGETAIRNVELSFSANKTFTVNGVTFEMVYVEGGTFTMGATSEQGSDAYSYEKPTHSVRLSNYYIGQTEVTQALWEAVMGETVSQIATRNGWNTDGVGGNYPMYYVSWNDVQDFIRKLNAKTGQTFRLPTEAEWEYAARGGSKSRGYKYSGSNTLGNVAWYDDNSGSKTHPVGTKQANELGLYDMSGNVWEWCQDWYGDYSSSTQTNPTGPYNGSLRVLRGGSWLNSARHCRVSDRFYINPLNRYNYSGIRLVLP